MEKRRRSPNVDKRMFDCVKQLLKAGSTWPEIEDYLGIGNTCISRIARAENWQDYTDQLAAIALKQREKKAKKAAEEKKAEQVKQPEENAGNQVVEHRQSVTVQTTYYVSQKLDAMTELLKGISAKLAFIVEDLCPTKKEA